MGKRWIATVDFESRSACNLKKSGAYKYSEHPTTDILCLAFRLPNWKKGKTALWHPAFPHLGMKESGIDPLVELFNWIITGELVEAHNAMFERALWRNIAVPRLGWPAIAGDQWRCSAAKAAAHALPRGLDDAAGALGLSIRKNAVGSKVMMKMNKPRKPRKAEVVAWQKEHGNAPMPLLYHESKELLDTLFAYCRQDVLTEEAVSDAVPDLSEAEQTLYTLDQTMNERGFLLDMDAVSCALDLIGAETNRLNGELKILTGGCPDKATQRKKMHDWFLDQWVIIEDTKAGTVDEALKRDDLTPKVRRGLELLQSLSRSSTAKFEAMRNWACHDGRVRGGLLYHGASTGRWSGAGVQPHNFPRGSVKDIDGAWRVLKTRDRAAIEAFNPKKEKAA
jgi:DNA polymerase bacteriophage-type